MFHGPHEVLATNGNLDFAVPASKHTTHFVVIEPDQGKMTLTLRCTPMAQKFPNNKVQLLRSQLKSPLSDSRRECVMINSRGVLDYGVKLAGRILWSFSRVHEPAESSTSSSFPSPRYLKNPDPALTVSNSLKSKVEKRLVGITHGPLLPVKCRRPDVTVLQPITVG